jgi:multidrug efflux pump subunit AcrA (membrane-fusion protein)
MPRASLLCLIGLLLFGSGCHRGDAARSTAKAPIPVHVRPVQDPSDTREARYSGTIEPATRVDVAFKVGG